MKKSWCFLCRKDRQYLISLYILFNQSPLNKILQIYIGSLFALNSKLLHHNIDGVDVGETLKQLDMAASYLS